MYINNYHNIKKKNNWPHCNNPNYSKRENPAYTLPEKDYSGQTGDLVLSASTENPISDLKNCQLNTLFPRDCN